MNVFHIFLKIQEDETFMEEGEDNDLANDLQLSDNEDEEEDDEDGVESMGESFIDYY